ncbi:MAG: hypothetical protein WD055_00545 [Candidatus Dependentiae bacterium]
MKKLLMLSLLCVTVGAFASLLPNKAPGDQRAKEIHGVQIYSWRNPKTGKTEYGTRSDIPAGMEPAPSNSISITRQNYSQG